MSPPHTVDVPCLSCQHGYNRSHACDEPRYCPCDRSDQHVSPTGAAEPAETVDRHIGELEVAICDGIAERLLARVAALSPAGTERPEGTTVTEWGVRNGRTEQWFTFSDKAVARVVAREQRSTLHVRTITHSDWIEATDDD